MTDWDARVSGCNHGYGLDTSAYPSAESMHTQEEGFFAAAKAAEALVTRKVPIPTGQVGRGRVVLDGPIALGFRRTAAGKKRADKLGIDPRADGFETPAFGLSRDLLVNGVRWLCGK